MQELFSQNTRKAQFKDLYSERVSGKKGQIGAIAGTAAVATISGASVILTGAAIPLVAAAASASSSAIINAGVFTMFSTGASVITPIAAAQQTKDGLKKETVTKIHAGKTVKANSFAESFQDEAHHYEKINLDYKDLLFKKITGKNSTAYSTNYEKTINEIATPLNEVFAAAESGNLLNPENRQKIVEDIAANPDKEKHGMAKHVASFLVPTEQEAKQSKDAIKKQLSARQRLEQERQEQQDNPRGR